MKKLRAVWQSLWGDADRRVRLGRVLGFTFVTAGFIVMGFAWNGAAQRNFITGQFPYVLSGGFMGLGLVVTGCTLLFLAAARSEREVMSKQFEEVARLLGRNLNRLSISSNGASDSRQVVAATTTYHRAECKILVGKDGLSTVTVEQAANEGLEPCRVCHPPQPATHEKVDASAN